MHSHVTITASVSDVCAAVIVRTSAVHAPAVSSTIDGVEVRPSEVEEVTMGIACIDTEVPISGLPVEGAIEVGGINKSTILPVEQNIAQVEIALLPVDAVEIGLCVDAHQIVEVYLERSFVLFLGEIQFIRHLVGQEEGLLACLFVTHGVSRSSECKQCHEGDDHFFHILRILNSLYSCSRCKDMNKLSTPKRIFPKLRGENPYKYIC